MNFRHVLSIDQVDAFCLFFQFQFSIVACGRQSSWLCMIIPLLVQGFDRSEFPEQAILYENKTLCCSSATWLYGQDNLIESPNETNKIRHSERVGN